jgi:hypothetical protein
MPDAEVAERTGRSENAVRMKRTKLGILTARDAATASSRFCLQPRGAAGLLGLAPPRFDLLRRVVQVNADVPTCGAFTTPRDG